MGTAPRLRQVNRIDLARASGKDRFPVEVDGVIGFFAEKHVSVAPNWDINPWILYRFDEVCGKKWLDADLNLDWLLANIEAGAYDQETPDL